MKLNAQQYAQALYDSLSQSRDKDHEGILDRFALVLKEQGDLEKYPEIEKEFERLQMKSQGISPAEITLAHDIKLEPKVLEELNDLAQTKLRVKTKIDETRIGGLIMKVDETFLDASIKTQLNNLNESLKE
jgi:F-type H+-transporting ATPase subunit delta